MLIMEAFGEGGFFVLQKRWISLLTTILMLCCAVAPAGVFAEDGASAYKQIEITALTPNETAHISDSYSDITFTPQYEGSGEIASIEFFLHDSHGEVIEEESYTAEEGDDSLKSATFRFYPDNYPESDSFYGRVRITARNGARSMIKSQWVFVVKVREQDGFQYYVDHDRAVVTGYVGEDLDNGLQIPAKLGRYPVRRIYASAFSYRSDLTGPLSIPDSVTRIGDNAFESCTGLTGSLTLPSKLAFLGNNAFCNCTGFTGALALPDRLTYIGNSAFDSCTGLTGQLVLPDQLTYIGDRAFNSCEGFTGSLVFPSTLTHIGDYAFVYCHFTGSLIFPKRITHIGDYAFYSCPDFTDSLAFPGGLKEIGEGAFDECVGLTDATVYAPAGSYAAAWAEENGYAFMAK